MSHSPHAYVAATYTPHLFTQRDVTDNELLGPPNSASLSVALHEVFFICHFAKPPIPSQVVSLPSELLGNLQQLVPGTRRIHWPPTELHHEEFIAVRDYLRIAVENVGLPTQGLTLEESREVTRRFFDGEHPLELRRRFSRPAGN
jgi:hypothetical protein